MLNYGLHILPSCFPYSTNNSLSFSPSSRSQTQNIDFKVVCNEFFACQHAYTKGAQQFQLNLPEKHTHSKNLLSEECRLFSGVWSLDTILDEWTTPVPCWSYWTFLPSWTMLTSQYSGAFFRTNSPFPIFFLSRLGKLNQMP